MMDETTENDFSCRWIIDGMKSMLMDGAAHVDMSFKEVQQVCEEPDIHEFENINEMLWCWEQAKMEYKRSLMPSRLKLG